MNQPRKLLIHVGLPKTATTFLQHRVFKKAQDLRLIHRSTEPELTRSFVRFLRSENPSDKKTDISRIKRELKNSERVVVSNENITITSSTFWEDMSYFTPSMLAYNLATLRQALSGIFDDMTVLLTARRQDYWLASRYAQSASEHACPCQEDFESWVRKILTENLQSHGAWINYHHLCTELSKHLGKGWGKVLFQEDLRTSPSVWGDSLEYGTGSKFIKDAFIRASPETKVSKSLKLEELVWRVRGSDEQIRLNDDLSKHILKVFSGSNRLLDSHFNLNCHQHGY